MTIPTLLAVLAVSRLAAADLPLLELPDSEWREVGKPSDSVSEQNPAGREKEDFWDKLHRQGLWNDVLDELCREVRVPLDYKLRVPGLVDARPSFDRFLRSAPDGRILLVDQTRARLSLGYGLPIATPAEYAGVSISAGASIDGTSLVVRRLKTKRACRELDALADLRTVKLALPLDADRFAAMELEELWVLPLRFSASLSLGASAAAGGVPLSVSIGYSRSGGASVSLRRLSPELLRVRLRFDYVRAFGPGGGVAFELLGSDFASLRGDGRELSQDALGELIGKQVVWRLVDRPLRRYFQRYLTGRLGLAAQWSQEDHALVELLLDPRDKEQMKALEQLLAGGRLDALDSLLKLGKQAGQALLDLQGNRERLLKMRRDYEAALAKLGPGPQSFTGAQRVDGSGNSVHLKLPVLADLSASSGKRDERVDLLDGSGRYQVYRAHKESSASLIDIPLLGRVVNYSRRRSAMSYTHQDSKGLQTAPALVYLHQEGYTMQPEDSARRLAATAADIMGLVGQGRDPRAALPLERVFPSQPRDHEHPEQSSYRRGVGAFTLSLSAQALREILSASPLELLRAYGRGYRGVDQGAVAAAFARLSLDGDGTPVFDGADEGDGALRVHLYYAQKLAKALQKIAAASPGGPLEPRAARAQAEAFRDLVAGSVGWGLCYDALMRVLVQLVRPENVSAELVLSAKPWEKDRKAIEGRYLYRRGLEDPELKRLSETISRFGGPSAYSD